MDLERVEYPLFERLRLHPLETRGAAYKLFNAIIERTVHLESVRG